MPAGRGRCGRRCPAGPPGGQVHSPAVTAAIGRLQTALTADRAYGPSTVQTNQQGDLAVVSVPVNGDPSGQAATATVRHLREVMVPSAFDGVDASVKVGGETAGSIDFFDLTRWYTPFAIAFVLGLSFLLLLVVFRSVVLPALGVALNLLSAGAAYGLLVLVFQHGTGAGLFGFQRVDAIQAWLPLFLFSVLFGLSMDYQVFLLSRCCRGSSSPPPPARRWREGCQRRAGGRGPRRLAAAVA